MPPTASHGEPRRGLRQVWYLAVLLATAHLQLAAAPGDPVTKADAGYRVNELQIERGGHAGFTLLSPERTGVDFTNTLSDLHAAENQIRLNGSGVALGDVDGDGWCDIFVCSLEGRVALYHNLGGFRFTNVAAASGLDLPGDYSTGAVLADVDGDGDLDLLLNGIGTGTRLFLNDGHGHFAEAADSGLVRRYGAMSIALADVDGDGYLDLYVANYRTNTVRSTGYFLLNDGGRRMVPPEERGHLEMTPQGRVLEHGEPHQFYRNDGKGRFRRVEWDDGTFLDEDGHRLKEAPHDWGLSCAFRDLNGDGAPDLYVCNDFHSPDRVWLNDGHGHFRAIPRLALRHSATFSMSVDFADVDRDGRDDILVSDMTSRDRGRRLMQIAGMDPYEIKLGVFDDRPQLDRTVLQWNRGDGTYADVASYAGLENSEWNWSVVFLDVDLDGYEDLLAATGHMFDTQDLDAQARIQAAGPYTRATTPKKLLMLPPLAQAKLALRNRGDLTFTDSSEAWGFHQVGVSHGMALADLDNDGDLDVVVNNLNAPLGLYRNETPAPRLAVRLQGLPPNTAGIGARIVVTGGPVTQSQEMMCGGRYLASDDSMRVFATGSPDRLLQIEVLWRSGRRSVVTDARPNCLYEIIEPSAANSSAGPASSPKTPDAPFFVDVSGLLNYQHHDDPFDDFGREPLLPRRMSQLGPGVAWFDLDGDGWDDLIVGSGKGGQCGVFRNDRQGGFQRWDEASWAAATTRDQTAVLGFTSSSGQRGILLGLSNFEDELAAGAAVRSFIPGQPQAVDVIGANHSSVGPLALADYDGDGQLELFVGGRVIPGRYPEPAKSQLWRQRDGGWALDAENSLKLADVGLVSGAVWTDLDGDGRPELVLACEWGPVRIFHNEKGKLRETTSELGFSCYLGWWNGVTAGDFDGDGNMDLLVTNWGLNTPCRATEEAPYRLYFGSLEDGGVLALVEASHDPTLQNDFPERDLAALSSVLPSLRDRFPTHAAFGRASVAELLGSALPKFRRLEVNTLSSMLFLNRTNRFVAVPLPPEAQFAAALAVCVGDFDGDGCEDAFLSQNFFATQTKMPRCDAGRGLWLHGDGHGGFHAVPGQESGVAVYGEQRGAAVGDFDADGRLDLVVTQNGGTTRLFRNMKGRPGLRVRLAGPPGNPSGIGAVLRLMDGSRIGPAREIHDGSGYWSSDSPVQVLSFAGQPTRMQVRWPGGKRTTSDLPPDAKEVVVNWQGELRTLR